MSRRYRQKTTIKLQCQRKRNQILLLRHPGAPAKGKNSSDDPAVELPEMTVTEKVKPPRTQTEKERYHFAQLRFNY
jgi:hypothetical protein